ncbi:MAG TPA: bacterial transcriptional activator domain-containing protein, partial [Actinocrinis sp.]|uniref:bacterial transcriptional activator domain-containing protein n=1 Tax=Actinocrinis sp. TaxID=1920516 RepID=UPI002DDCFEF7
HAPEESQPPSVENRVLFGLAGAPLLAAGLYKALGRHRRRQLWHRAFGRRPVTPTGDAAVAEESIRIGSREVEVWFLDLALRGLSAGLAERDHPIPDAYAVKLRTEGIELMLSRQATPEDLVQPPEPWVLSEDGRSWNFSRPRITDVHAQAAHRRFAPYPGLVTIGGVGTDRVMIDLEEARGVVGFGGHRDRRRAALAALAVELATNSWSDRMTVTLVGFPGDLTPLAPARVRHAATLEEILPALEAEAAERVTALAAAGLVSVLDGRSRASQAGSFPPHFVVVADEPHPATAARLVDIAATASRVGMGFAVAGDVPGATWQFDVSSDGRLSARQLGIEVDAQLLPDDQYVAVLGMFRAVCDIEGMELPTGLVHQSVGYGGPLPDEPPSVFVAMLGPLELSGIGATEPDKTPLLREALVFLLHHRDGVHPRVLAAALWPLGATAAVAEATFARLATWLGEDPHGEPNLQTDDEGRLHLGPYVWSDWDMFQSLQERALHHASGMSQEQRDQLLKVAMDLVRGPFLADREAGRYGWLAYEVAEAQIPAIIADTALRLSDSLTAAGLAESAIEAVKAGMRGSPDDEELWRGLLRATAASGDTERLRGAVEGLYKRTWYVHGVQGLHPRTEALVDELLPSWREVVVG